VKPGCIESSSTSDADFDAQSLEFALNTDERTRAMMSSSNFALVASINVEQEVRQVLPVLSMQAT
jgi:hypothetical protein